jgi:hypothetical protein
MAKHDCTERVVSAYSADDLNAGMLFFVSFDLPIDILIEWGWIKLVSRSLPLADGLHSEPNLLIAAHQGPSTLPAQKQVDNMLFVRSHRYPGYEVLHLTIA